MTEDKSFTWFNRWVFQLIGIATVFITLNALVIGAYHVEWVPSINHFVKNNLMLLGFPLLVLAFFLLRSILLKNYFLLIVFVLVSVLLLFKFKLQSSFMGSYYREQALCELSHSHDIHLSKIKVQYGTNVYRVYKSHFPFVNVMRDIEADSLWVADKQTDHVLLKTVMGNKKDSMIVSYK
jgi:hypothetical protein